MVTYYIGADVHSKFTEIAVEDRKRIISRHRVATTILEIRKVLSSIKGQKHMVIEEGIMSGWLYRNLSPYVDRFVVCDPRRNKLIACDGDKDDKIDAAKLASLLRGRYLREVYHSQDNRRIEFKQWVSSYHDRVKDAVRNINKLRAKCRMHGISIPRCVLRDPARREQWLRKLNNPMLGAQLQMLWIGYDATAEQVKIAKDKLSALSEKFEIIQFWGKLPGVGLIRSATLFAYLDTPWRFKTKSKLWKYCGVGLQRKTSGTLVTDPKKTKLCLAWAINKKVKSGIIGAAETAIRQGKNVFSKYHQKLIDNNVKPVNARHAVARKMLVIMWGMWKSNSRFDETMTDAVEKCCSETVA